MKSTPDLPQRYAELLRSEHPESSAALATDAVNFRDLDKAYREARRALDVARVVLGQPCVVQSTDLEAFIVLDGLVADETALSIASKTLLPLLNYDERAGKPLLQTLEVYLNEGCNASRAARRLFLNRHSLLYRIAKIEELTGYHLDCRDDRFLFELSLRMHRLSRVDGGVDKQRLRLALGSAGIPQGLGQESPPSADS